MLLRRMFLFLWLLSFNLQAADIAVSNVNWRAPIPGQSVGVLYFSLRNDSAEPIVFNDISLDWAKKAEFHEHSYDNGMMRMRRVERIELAPEQLLNFESGGLHVMVFGISADTINRPSLPLRLIAEDGRQIALDAKK